MNIIFNFKKPGRFATAAAIVLLLSSAACSSATSNSSSESSGAAVSVVASTNVWGDVATQVAGALAGHAVSVRSIITDPAADPHSYEVTTRDELAIKRADVIVENGGGYDDFVGRMRSAAGGK